MKIPTAYFFISKFKFNQTKINYKNLIKYSVLFLNFKDRFYRIKNNYNWTSDKVKLSVLSL
jgi:hypothetical protein